MMNKTISCGFKHLNDKLQFEIACYLDETGITHLRLVCRELHASITSDIFTDALQWRFGYLLAAKPSELTSVLNRIPEQNRNPEKIYKALASSTNTIIKKYDKKKVLAAVNFSIGDKLEYASDALRNDKEVVLAAVKLDGRALKYASADLKNDKDVVLAAMKQNGWALCWAGDDLRNDKVIVLAAVKQHGIILFYASADLKNDTDVVLAAVKQNGMALKFASAKLKKDPDIRKLLQVKPRKN